MENKNHKICVVIPCRNEVNFIEECVQAIYNSEGLDDSEIVVHVVDGMSNDGTREKINDLKQTYPSLVLVDNEKQLTPFAFNLGIKSCVDATHYQIIGARHIVSSNYLFNALRKIDSDESVWCVGGRIVNEYLSDTGKIIALSMGSAFGMGIGNFRTLSESGFTDTVTSPMYPSKVFEQIGLFDEELIRNQDDDFNFRVSRAGGKIFLDAEISLKYYVRGTFSGLFRQFFQYGYWKVYVNKKHGVVTTIRQLIPPLFVLYLMGLPFTLIFGCVPFLFMLIPLALYVVLDTVVSMKIALREKVNMLKLMFTYPILHISYGAGYWKGLFHFVLLNRKPSDREKRLSR